MTLSAPAGFSTATKAPVIALAVNLGVSSRGSGSARKKLMLLGNKTAAGAAVIEQPVQIFSLDDASAYFGPKSELYHMCRAVFLQYRNPTLSACPVAENGSAAAATAALAFATNPSAAGTVTLTVNGVAFQYSAATTDTPTSIAAGLAALVSASTTLPVSASASSGTLTLTAANKGTRGNNLRVRCQLTTSGTTVALNGGTAAARVDGNFASGTGADDITLALAAIATKRYDRIAVAHDDAANLGRLKIHVNTYAGISERKRQQGNAACVGSIGAATTLASDPSTGLNAPRIQIAWHKNAENLTGSIAAQIAAGLLWGDGQVGGGIGRVQGEESYPANNTDGLLLASITEQAIVSDQPLGTHIESALNAGVTPLAPSPSNPGYCRVVRSITTRCADAQGNANYSVIDVSKVTVSDYLADTLESKLANEFPNKNIGAEPANGSGPTNANIIFPSMVRSFIAKCLYEEEAKGNIANVTANLPLLSVEVASDNSTMLLAEIPESVVAHFHSFAGSVDQIG